MGSGSGSKPLAKIEHNELEAGPSLCTQLTQDFKSLKLRLKSGSIRLEGSFDRLGLIRARH